VKLAIKSQEIISFLLFLMNFFSVIMNTGSHWQRSSADLLLCLLQSKAWRMVIYCYKI